MMAPRAQNKVLYAQPSPIARRLFWHLFATATQTFHSATHFDPLIKPGAILLWVESGNAELRLDGNIFQLRRGPSFWLCSVQQQRSHHPIGGRPYILHSIRFSGPNLGAWLDELDAKTKPEFLLTHPNFVNGARRELTRLAGQRSTDWELRVHNILAELLGRFLAIRRRLPLPNKDLPKPILKVFTAIEAEPDRAWQAIELALIAGVSYSYLRRIFRESLHQSIHSHLQQQRLDRARILLAEGQLNVKEVSQKLHFGHEFYFSNFFKARTGISPSRFRKQWGLA